MELNDKENRLKEILGEYGTIAIAYSGGVDSTLLAYLSDKYAKTTLLISVKTPFLTKKEFEFITAWTKKQGLTLNVIKVNPLLNRAVSKNPKNRCYLCKKVLFKKIIKLAAAHQISTVADGTNVNDLDEYRPGLLATEKLGIKHPFVMAGICKEDIRTLARKYNLENANTPSQACLATRVPYGSKLKNADLRKIECAENFIKSFDISVCRVRKIGGIAKIETDINDIYKLVNSREKVIKYLKNIGFSKITIDLEGYKTGN